MLSKQKEGGTLKIQFRQSAHLSLYVHERDSVATVTYDKLVIGLGQGVNGVNSDITLTTRNGRLEGVNTLGSLQVPQLKNNNNKQTNKNNNIGTKWINNNTLT